MPGTLHLAVADGVATLTIDNPAKLNAMDSAMWRAMPSLLAQAAEDAAVRVLVLTGAGERAFCSGNDISEFETLRASLDQVVAYNAWQREVQEALREFPKPAIAAIHGHCLGAGLEFALQCDVRLCSAEARFGIPAVRLGLPYRHEDIVKLLDVLPPPKAREMVLLGRRYDGAQAEAMGLVHRCLPDRSALSVEVAAMAAELAAHAPLSLAAAKAAFRELLRRDGPPDLARLDALADACYASADYAEGRAAFREKRTPRFTGR